MILKNIFGKTIEAAKKSARQMYGDDLLIMDSEEGKDGKQASVKIFSDDKNQQKDNREPNNQTGKQGASAKKPGVHFERSNANHGSSQTEKKRDNLSNLRKFALQLEQGNFADDAEKFTREERLQSRKTSSIESKKADTQLQNGSEHGTTAYSRSSIRKPYSKDNNDKPFLKEFEANKAEQQSSANTRETTGANKGFITHFKQSESSRAKQRQPLMVPPNRNDQREIKALHKRFDKLEALLDSTLISSNLDYASHPAFQQLVQTGINTTVVAGWFSEIISKGIDPEVQPEQFMNRLAKIIRNALGEAAEDSPQKFMLFVGPSGSGKTSLIMKLSQDPELMEDKKIAVVTICPEQVHTPYYTVLEPFCNDHDLPYFKIKTPKDIHQYLTEWEGYDHILIDTPSINIERDNSFRDFWKIRQILTPLTPLEIHYVVNASLNRFYFKNSSASHHPLQPDYVAITHLDEVSEWGPLIPFLQKMECNTRYITRGNSIPGSIDHFDPRWFAQRILQEN